MITVISSSGPEITSRFDKRFGRAKYYCIYNETSQQVMFLKNDHSDDPDAAGEKAVQLMLENGVGKVISGDFGIKVSELLNKNEIQMVVLRNQNNTIENIISEIQ